MFEKAAELIASYNTVIIHRHTNPDGDAIGAQAGLRHLINDNFPGKKVYIVGDSPKRYSFMDDSAPDTIGDDTYRGALAVILDTSSAALISDDRWKLAGHTLRIDHHIFCEKIADDEITDTSYESCCGIVADMARTLGWRLGVTAAKSLYTGMVTDSGRFRYDSVTPRTFGLAAYLTSVKFDTGSIFTELYADTYQNVLNRAKFVLKIRFTEKGTAYIYNTKEEVAQSGLEPFAVSRGMVGTMAGSVVRKCFAPSGMRITSLPKRSITAPARWLAKRSRTFISSPENIPKVFFAYSPRSMPSNTSCP